MVISAAVSHDGTIRISRTWGTLHLNGATGFGCFATTDAGQFSGGDVFNLQTDDGHSYQVVVTRNSETLVFFDVQASP